MLSIKAIEQANEAKKAAGEFQEAVVSACEAPQYQTVREGLIKDSQQAVDSLCGAIDRAIAGEAVSAIELTSKLISLAPLIELVALLPWVQSLKISCPDMNDLPEALARSKLTSLEIRLCEQLECVNHLPAALQYLQIGYCVNLRTLRGNLPSQLREVSFSWCPRVASLPKVWPGKLERVNAGCCLALDVKSRLSLQGLKKQGCGEIMFPPAPSWAQASGPRPSLAI